MRIRAQHEHIKNVTTHPALTGEGGDFDKATSRNTDETITLLARMARFVIADISDDKSVLQELRAIVPELRVVPGCARPRP